MTPACQPHPKRCETCWNTACEYHEIRDNMSAGRDERTGWRASPAVITFAVGCVSHTSTPAPALDEKCYIITENELSEIIGFQIFAKPELARAIRSRPAPPAQAIHMCCDICGSVAPHFDGNDQWLCTKCLKAQIAKVAREKVLDEAVKLLWQIPFYGEGNDKQNAIEMLESLRAQPESTSREK